MLDSSDIKEIRKDFPVLQTLMNGKPLVYLDNAATTQKPWSVIRRVSHYYETFNANVQRGFYALSEKATFELEQVRKKTSQFIGAKNVQEIIFTSGATESSNLIAHGLESYLQQNDSVLLGGLEHNSLSAPWLDLAKRKNLNLKIIPFLENGIFDQEKFKSLLTPHTRIIAITWVSNFLGTIQPVQAMAKLARSINPSVVIIVDATQALPYIPVQVGELGINYLFFSSHKMLGPMGVGVLWGNKKDLELLYPYKVGGGAIEAFKGYDLLFKELPERLEAGSPNVEGILGFGAALDYLNNIGMLNILVYEQQLKSFLEENLTSFHEFNLMRKGQAESVAMATGYFLGINSHDAVAYLDAKGIAVRSGALCSYLAVQQLKAPACIRASFYFYNTLEEVSFLVENLKKIKSFLAY